MPATPTHAASSKRRPIQSPCPQAAQTPQPGTPERLRHLNHTSSPKRKPLPVKICQPIQNRVPVLLVHIPKLSIRGQARLAAEVGVSRSTVSRLVHGRINPSYRLARGVTSALERLLGRPLDMRDVFSTDGTYLTPSGCALCKCGGCLPEAAWAEDGTLKPDWKGARPGDWSLARPADPPLHAGPDNRAGGIAAAGKEAE